MDRLDNSHPKIVESLPPDSINLVTTLTSGLPQLIRKVAATARSFFSQFCAWATKGALAVYHIFHKEESSLSGQQRAAAAMMDVRQCITTAAQKGTMSPRFIHSLIRTSQKPTHPFVENAKVTLADWDSLLDNPQVISDKTLFHILGDSIGIARGGVAGYDQATAWNQCIALLNAVGSALKLRDLLLPIQQSLSKGLQLSALISSKKIDEAKEWLLHHIQALPTGESIVFPGGWTTPIGGHAIVYEFIKGSRAHNNSFIVYNTGSGSNYHPSQLVDTKQTVSKLVIDNVSTSAIRDRR